MQSEGQLREEQSRYTVSRRRLGHSQHLVGGTEWWKATPETNSYDEKLGYCSPWAWVVSSILKMLEKKIL